MKQTAIIFFLISVCILSFCQSIVDTTLTYKDLVNRDITKMSHAQKDSTFLGRFNEIREEENKKNPSLKLKPFKYSLDLEEVAQYFLDNKKVFLDENREFIHYAHADDNNDGPLARFKALKIKYILVSEGNILLGAGEDLLALAIGSSVYDGCEAWRSSPKHWAQIVSSVNTHVGFAYKKEGSHIIVVADFAKLE